MSRGHLSWRRQREGVKRAHIAANRGFSQGPAGPAVSLITGRLFDCEARPSRPAKWPMPKAQTAHVFARLAEMRAAVGTDPAEERVWQTLRCSGMKWKRWPIRLAGCGRGIGSVSSNLFKPLGTHPPDSCVSRRLSELRPIATKECS